METAGRSRHWHRKKLVWSQTVTCEFHAASDVLEATESHLAERAKAGRFPNPIYKWSNELTMQQQHTSQFYLRWRLASKTQTQVASTID